MPSRLLRHKFGFAAANAIILAVVTGVLWRKEPYGFDLVKLLYGTIGSNVYIGLFPHEPILLYFGKVCGYWSASVVAVYGAYIAGIVDYETLYPCFTHDRIQRLYADRKAFKIAVRWFYKRPFWSIVVAALTPLPFYPFKFLAIATGYGRLRYLSALIIGRFPRYVVFTWLADYFDIPNWILIALVVWIAAFGGWGIVRHKWQERKKAKAPRRETPAAAVRRGESTSA